MSVETLLIWIIVGAIAGWLAGLVVRGFGFGLVGNIIIGIIGAFLGGWLFAQFGIAIGVGGRRRRGCCGSGLFRRGQPERGLGAASGEGESEQDS